MTLRSIGIWSVVLELLSGSILKFKRAIDEIAGAPQRWARGSFGTRRFLLRGFPFLLIYRERNFDIIEIVAIAHTSRRPNYWKART